MHLRDKWSEDDQAGFTHYLGQCLAGWEEIAKDDLGNLFSGEEESIDRLTTLVSGGTFIGGIHGDSDNEEQQQTIVQNSVARTFYSFAIPALWQASGHHPFIIDTGHSCDDKAEDDESLKSACYNNQLYKLADPDGTSHPCEKDCGLIGGCTCNDTPFSSLAGVEYLDGEDWGGITVQDLIIGYVFQCFKMI